MDKPIIARDGAEREMELAGLRILITRPAGRADDLVRAIATAGGTAVQVPMLTVAPLDQQRDASQWQHTTRALRQLAQYRRVIAISINAVHYGLSWLAQLREIAPAVATTAPPSQPAAITVIDWYGIGAATAAEFARWGIVAQGGGSGATSEALLALPDLQNVRGETILILRGVGGRETLAGVLRERGATVDYAECYRRSAPLLDESQRRILRSGGFAAVCVNSAETLRNLFDSLVSTTIPAAAATPAQPATLDTLDIYRATALLVPSERVAQLALELGFREVMVAANAGTEATLTALRDIAKRKLLRERQ